MSSFPLILSENLFDDVILNPTHVVSQSGTAVSGSEVWHIADNLRDLTSFTVSDTNTDISITVDCGSAKYASMVVLDRGHNLKGKTVEVRASTDNFGASNVLIGSYTVPSTAGGLGSDSNGCLTADSVWWKSFSSVSYRYWRVVSKAMGASLSPVITGLYLGDSYRLPTYLNSPGAYDYRFKHQVLKSGMSERGVRIKRRIINFSEIDIKLQLEETEFVLLHPHAMRLIQYNHPWWFCIDDSVYAGGCELMRLYQLPGEATYDPVMNPVHRSVQFLLEEVIPSATM